MEGGRHDRTRTRGGCRAKAGGAADSESPSKMFTNLSYNKPTKGIVTACSAGTSNGCCARRSLLSPRRLRVRQLVRWYSINPYGNSRKNWDLAQAIILVFVSITVLFRVGLKQPAEVRPISRAPRRPLLLVRHRFNFCTGYEAEEEEGVIVYHPKLIRAHYFKTWFTIDLLACLPVDLALRRRRVR